MATREKTLFIGGTLFAILFFLVILLIQSSLTRGPKGENLPLISSSKDLLVSKQTDIRDTLPSDRPFVTFIDPQRGAENPTVIITEFSDFSCPFCHTVQDTLLKILDTYPNDVRHVWKDAPHDALYQESVSAHIAARCAQKQQKFWEYHDLLFDNQASLSNITYGTIARELGLDVDTWQRCFDGKEERAKVERSLTEAEVLGVDSTPYFFINETRISGTVSFDEFDTIISEKLGGETL